jgi:hypothetical protein
MTNSTPKLTNDTMPGCKTQPGTPEWSRHVAEIKRLADQSQRIGNPGVMLALTMLHLWHKNQEWTKKEDVR